MLRKISAVFLGLLVSVLTVTLVEWVSHQVYPLPPDLDFKDAEKVRIYVSSLPLGAFLAILLGWLLGTLTGGLAACRVARDNPVVFACIIGALMMAATVANLMMIPHPSWFAFAAIGAIVAGTLLAIRWSSATGSVSRAV